MPRNLKITLAYDGTAYVGWQRQARGVSVQGLVEESLARIDGAPVTVHGAGRTDAGVHAIGQVASARVSTRLDAPTLRRALNSMLPPDIRVAAVEDVAPGFHARYDAIGKTYEYRIWQGEVQPPFVRAWSWHIPRHLDVAAMDAAARAIEGTHDFTVFQSRRGSVKTAVRTITTARVRAVEPPYETAADPRRSWPSEPGGRGWLVVTVEANGFLRHMVRAIVGTLVEVGDGRREAGSMAALVDARDRTASGPTAPAHGLLLVRVAYPPPAGEAP
jgi:tRNA pseudouridine38-40 synthase